MKLAAVNVRRLPERLLSDDKRVITRSFEFSAKRSQAILERALQIDEAQIPELLATAREKFYSRHADLEATFERNFQAVAEHLDNPEELSTQRQLLIGAYFTLEYSIESAALFNPSIARHPDQAGLSEDAVRFVMSLRATGEGHLSSIVFRQGTITGDGDVQFDRPPEFAAWIAPEPMRWYDKRRFMRKLLRIQPHLSVIRRVLDRLPDPFEYDQLKQVVQDQSRRHAAPEAFREVAEEILWLAQAHYTLDFPPGRRPGERVIFPATSHEIRGMEDLRLVRLEEEEGEVGYYGTYGAFDGMHTVPMLLKTTDFTHFEVCPLGGRYATGKGMALFPRRVGGQYLAISRHDGENLYLLESNDLHFWEEGQLLQRPVEPWELVQIGNCGSPLETDAGWLLITHGVGLMREYSIGAMLLDRDDPTQVIGRLREPLLVPTTEEREGYVPNVVYSCGSMIHRDMLILPYAVSDVATRFAIVLMPELLDYLLASGP